ncbi:MAG: WGR domain-containing protein [Iphinoe sp. HA4291-MV1]|jgi:hypothetical protein|nr:WGR domain-containing protein [Iphinoe sp. HA4291-MV1]
MFNICAWKAWRWQTDSRFYTAEIVQDLFGDWVVRLGWGGLHNRSGNTSSILAASYLEAQDIVEKIRKRRLQRGYNLMSGGYASRSRSINMRDI